MTYQALFLPAAKKDLKRLRKSASKEQLEVIKSAIVALAEDPRPSNAKAMVGYPGYLRLRTGDFRIVSRPDDKVLEILVVAVGDRGDIYQQLRRRLL